MSDDLFGSMTVMRRMLTPKVYIRRNHSKKMKIPVAQILQIKHIKQLSAARTPINHALWAAVLVKILQQNPRADQKDQERVYNGEVY